MKKLGIFFKRFGIFFVFFLATVLFLKFAPKYFKREETVISLNADPESQIKALQSQLALTNKQLTDANFRLWWLGIINQENWGRIKRNMPLIGMDQYWLPDKPLEVMQTSAQLNAEAAKKRQERQSKER